MPAELNRCTNTEERPDDRSHANDEPRVVVYAAMDPSATAAPATTHTSIPACST